MNDNSGTWLIKPSTTEIRVHQHGVDIAIQANPQAPRLLVHAQELQQTKIQFGTRLSTFVSVVAAALLSWALGNTASLTLLIILLMAFIQTALTHYAFSAARERYRQSFAEFRERFR